MTWSDRHGNGRWAFVGLSLAAGLRFVAGTWSLHAAPCQQPLSSFMTFISGLKIRVRYDRSRSFMVLRLQHFLIAALRLMAVAVCCVAILCSWALARADYLFRQHTVASVRRAISIVPDAWAYYVRLAELDPAHTRELLTTAVHLNPYAAKAEIELGLDYEAKGDYVRAEQWLLHAFAVDRTYLPRWSLANFYLRRGNMKAFWTWARRAAAMPSDSTESLFELCWRVSPDANEITRRIVNNNPKLLRQYLAFLLTRDQPAAASEIAIRLIQYGDSRKDVPLMFSAIDHLVAAGDGDQAKTIWTILLEKRWVVADSVLPNNPDFARDPLPVSFDWMIPSNSGCHSVPGPLGLETQFSGLQPDRCTIADQAVVLNPGKYVMQYSYRTEGIAPGTGLRWQIIAAGSKTPLAQSSDLSSDARTRAKLAFSIPSGVSVAHLRLIYQRSLGTTLISGSLDLSSVSIQAVP